MSQTPESGSTAGDEDTSVYVTEVVVITDSGYTNERYQTAGTHEMGHVLGWQGHSTDAGQLMHFSANNYTVATPQSGKDIPHLAQLYNLYY